MKKKVYDYDFKKEMPLYFFFLFAFSVVITFLFTLVSYYYVKFFITQNPYQFTLLNYISIITFIFILLSVQAIKRYKHFQYGYFDIEKNEVSIDGLKMNSIIEFRIARPNLLNFPNKKMRDNFFIVYLININKYGFRKISILRIEEKMNINIFIEKIKNIAPVRIFK